MALETQATLVGDAGSFELLKADTSGLRKFKMLAYTGAEVTRWYGRAVVDVEGMSVPKKLPILLNHDSNDVAGYASESELSNGRLTLKGVLLSGEAGPRVAAMSDDGFPLTASIGVTISATEEVEAGQTAKCNGRDVEGPCTIWRKTTLFETSFITANPADKATTAAALTQEHPMTPEEFSKANPAAVKAWKDEATKAERESLMGNLGALLKAIPGRTEFVLAQFSTGADVSAAKVALCDVLIAEAEEKAAAVNAQVNAQVNAATNPVLEALKAKAGNPGIGFAGADREGGETLAHLDPLERAKAEIAKSGLHGMKPEHLAAFYRAEAAGLVRPDLVTRTASAMSGA